MQNITIHKDTDIGLYTILIGGEVVYECLADDEVVGVVKDLLNEERMKGK